MARRCYHSAAPALGGLFGWTLSSWGFYIFTMIVIMIPQVLINIYGIKLTAMLNDFSVYWHIGGVLVIALLRGLAWLQEGRGESDAAVSTMKRGLRQAIFAGDAEVLSASYHDLGQLLLSLGRPALAAEELAEVVAGQAGGGLVVGLDQAGDVVVLDGAVDGDRGDAGGLSLGQGVVPAAGVGGADDQAAEHEDVHDASFRSAHGLEDGDLPALLHHDHGQRADDVEGGHDDDHHQDERHADLFKLQRGEEVPVHLDPGTGKKT